MTDTLIHITPALLTDVRDIELMSIESQELGLVLRADDVRVGRPWPNKRYKVAYLKGARKAQIGIMLACTAPPDRFEVVVRWIGAVKQVHTHRVHYELLDREHAAYTDRMILWAGTTPEFGGWKNRCWPGLHNVAPVQYMPRMELVRQENESSRPSNAVDHVDKQGVILERTQRLELPSIEPARFERPVLIDLDRMPSNTLRVPGG